MKQVKSAEIWNVNTGLQHIIATLKDGGSIKATDFDRWKEMVGTVVAFMEMIAEAREAVEAAQEGKDGSTENTNTN